MVNKTYDELMDEINEESRVWIDDVLLQDDGIIYLLSSSEQSAPELRNMSVTIPGRHGAYDFGAYMEPREFVLHAVFRRQNYANLKRQLRELNSCLYDEYGRPKTVTLRFGDELDKFYYARLTGAIVPELTAHRGFIEIPLTAFDPYAYSRYSTDEIVWGSEEITFEYYYLLGLGGTGGGEHITSPTSINVYNDGVSVSPVIEIDGKANNLRISVNGKSFTLPNFSSTRWVIDGESFAVTRNGSTDLDAMSGDFLTFVNGDNNVNITGTNMDFELTIKHRDKYV